MRKIIWIALAAVALTACSEQEKTFTVKGTVTGAQEKTLYLQNKSLDGTVLMDSVKLGEDGAFAFTAAAPTAPDFYQLTLEGQIINIAIDSTETVVVTASQPGMGQNYRVEGSDANEQIRQIALKQQALLQGLYNLQNSALTIQEASDSLENMVKHFKEDLTMNYIYQAPASTYAYFALHLTLNGQTLFNRQDADDLKALAAVATSWDTYYPESERTKLLHNTALKGLTDNRIANVREQMLQEETTIVDSGLLELELPDATGRIRTLTELKGQVVLLDFHAFSMDESAARILQLRELYNKYHGQGLQIYQVSVDPDEHMWKQATQSLPWICVYDPEGRSAMSYNVRALPEFFLIDRSNTLYKRSSQMNDVEAEIRNLLR